MAPNSAALKDWKYQKHMEFLMPYMFSRRTLTKKEKDPLKEDDLTNTDDAFETNIRIFKPELNYKDEEDPNEDEYSKLSYYFYVP